MLSFEEARARVLEGAQVLGRERISVDDACGRVLAEELVSDRSLPGFDYSAMDGYALRASDANAPGARLRVVSESRTGRALPGPLGAGEACRIFTGARLPEGADAVEMQERTQREGAEDAADAGPYAVRLEAAVRAGQHVRRAGEDLAVGAPALRAGLRLSFAHVGLLHALERGVVTVARRPVVAVLSTGDELRDAGTPSRAGTVVDGNGPALAALARRCGARVLRLPRVPDERPVVAHAVREALACCDVLLTVGGVSVGTHDVVRAALEDAGVALGFWRVALKPGKPLALGRGPAGQRVLALPGNPASALLTCALFGAPLLRALQGDAEPVPTLRAARLEAPVPHAPGRTELVRARLRYGDDGELRATPLAGQASGSVVASAWADGFVLVPAAQGDLAAGALVRVLPWEAL